MRTLTFILIFLFVSLSCFSCGGGGGDNDDSDAAPSDDDVNDDADDDVDDNDDDADDDSLPPPQNEESFDYGDGKTITTAIYTGRLTLPAGVDVNMNDIEISAAFSETTHPDENGHFEVRMNMEATGLITAKLNGKLFMMSVFNKHPDLVQVNPEISTTTTAVALISLMPGIQFSDPRIDALIQGYIKNMDGFSSLKSAIGQEMVSDSTVLANPTEAIFQAMNPLLIELLEEVEAKGHIMSALDECFDSSYNSGDTNNADFSDLDGYEQDQVFIKAEVDDENRTIDLDMANTRMRWVTFYTTENDGFRAIMPPRSFKVPKIKDIAWAVVEAGASSVWNQVFGDDNGGLWEEIGNSLNESLTGYFDCKYLSAQGVPLPDSALSTLDSYTFGNTPFYNDHHYLPTVLTLLSQGIFPVLEVFADIGDDVIDVEKITGLDGAQLLAIETFFGGFASIFDNIILFAGNGDWGEVGSAVWGLVKDWIFDDDFWMTMFIIVPEDIHWIVLGNMTELSNFLDCFYNPVKWIDMGVGAGNLIVSLYYTFESIMLFESADSYKVVCNQDNCPGDEFESNENKVNAALLSVPVDSQITYDNLQICPYDEDWFKIVASTWQEIGCIYQFEISFNVAQGDLDLKLYDASGALLDSSTGNTNSETVSADAQFIGQTLAAQVYAQNEGVSNAYTLNVSLDCGGLVDDDVDDDVNDDMDDDVDDDTTEPTTTTTTLTTTTTTTTLPSTTTTVITTTSTTSTTWVSDDEEVFVPAGSFWMGCEPEDGDCRIEESPRHEVWLSAYYIDTYEVTNARFAEFLTWHGNECDEYKCVTTDLPRQRLYESDSIWSVDSGYEDHPVILVTWYGAKAYCDAQGKRLPTEAEWEKAAKGTMEHYIYPWGDSWISNAANYWDSGDPYEKDDWSWTTPVGYYDGSNHDGTYQTTDGRGPYGAHDMAGNVWEWVNDWYYEDYYNEYLPDAWPADPQGPANGTYRVCRGSCWYLGTHLLRVSNRFNYSPGTHGDASGDFGFRCARD